jgi:formylglycine-generating enzyme required for sulfatase activity
MRCQRLLVGLLLILISVSFPALAEKRVALVIGNSTYKHAGTLDNPKNDAADMSAALKKVGFVVVDGFDLDKTSLDRKVRDFATALQGATVGVFFYAGHGLQVAGQNYIVPIDAELSTASALDFEMVRLDLVQRTMERESQTNILFLDACRNNPLARNLARAMGTRAVDIGRGLAPVESGVGTLISFSTQPGNVALDGSGRNSPFAGALTKRIASSRDDLSALLIDVRNDVRKETSNKQVPWEHSALTGRFYFNAPQTQAAPPMSARSSEAAEVWALVKDTKDIRALDAFRRQYGATNAFFDRLAEARMEELKKQQATNTDPSWWERLTGGASPAPPPKSGPTEQVAIATPPTPPPRPPARCDGVEMQVGSERRCLKPKESFRDCPTCPEMVVAPGGSFTMGSPSNEPQRDNDETQALVSIPAPFAAGKYAVTFDEWDACVGDGGCNGYEPKGWRGKHPVIKVNWDDAKAYAAWLSRKTGKTYRLLSETEREYVTRAGTATPFWWGSSITPAQANYDGSVEPYKGGGSEGEYRRRTVPVDSFEPNPWGLYNVHGNVWEWTEDCWYGSNTGNPGDGRARTTGDCNQRVVRGGSWANAPWGLRSASRAGSITGYRDSDRGFRLARTLNP